MLFETLAISASGDRELGTDEKQLGLNIKQNVTYQKACLTINALSSNQFLRTSADLPFEASKTPGGNSIEGRNISIPSG